MINCIFVIYKHFDDYGDNHWSKPITWFFTREEANKELIKLKNQRKSTPVSIDFNVEEKRSGELL